MRLVVIESPYAGLVDRNVDYARECVRDCLRRGESPYASHLFFTQPGVLNDDIPEERTLGIDAGLAWAAKADASVLYMDHGMSRGMVYGIRNAVRSGRKIEIRRLYSDVKELDHAAVEDVVREALKEKQEAFLPSLDKVSPFLRDKVEEVITNLTQRPLSVFDIASYEKAATANVGEVPDVNPEKEPIS